MTLQPIKNAEAEPQTVLVSLTVSDLAIIRAALNATARSVSGTGMERDMKALHGRLRDVPGIRGIVKRSSKSEAAK